MGSSEDDIKDIINVFVKSQFDEERTFLEDLKKSGIKVCDKISTETHDGKDSIKIVTQLLDHKEQNNLEKGSDFYIASTIVSNKDNQTNITTVVGKKDSNLEVVCSASVAQQGTGNKLVSHNSFVRPVQKSRLRHSTSLKNPETSGDDNKSKVTKRFSFKNLPQKKVKDKQTNKNTDEAVYSASGAKQGTGNKLVSHNSSVMPVEKSTLTHLTSFNKPEASGDEEVTDDVPAPTKSKVTKRLSFKNLLQKKVKDKQANKHTDEHQSPSTSDKGAGSIGPSKETNKIIDIKKNLPFESFKIGSESKIFQNILSKNKDRSVSVSGPKVAANSVSIVTNETNPVNTTSITTTINKSEDPDVYNAFKDIGRQESEIWQRRSQENLSVIHTSIHIDINPDIKTDLRRASCPNLTCHCKVERCNLIADVINQMVDNTFNGDYVNKLNEFDSITNHRHNCPFNNIDTKMLMQSPKWMHSHTALHQHCQSCESLDAVINLDLRKSMESLVDCVNDEVVDISEKDIEYLKQVTDYVHFEKCIRRHLGTRPTPYNFSRLLYITRTIIRQIGNPYDNNENIDRVYQFVVKFYGKHFHPHIKKHHIDLVDFLFKCECDDFDDVQ